MSENEVKKEKATVKMNVWFIIFVVYLVASLALIYNQNQTITALNEQVATLSHTIENNVAESNSRTEKIIHQLETIVTEYKESLMEKEDDTNNEVVTPVVPEVSVGTYTGSTVTETANVQMTLTLSENNVASLTSVDEAGEAVYAGTYTVVESTVVFTSEDGLAVYSFTTNEDGSLTLVDNEVVLTLNK